MFQDLTLMHRFKCGALPKNLDSFFKKTTKQNINLRSNKNVNIFKLPFAKSKLKEFLSVIEGRNYGMNFQIKV